MRAVLLPFNSTSSLRAVEVWWRNAEVDSKQPNLSIREVFCFCTSFHKTLSWHRGRRTPLESHFETQLQQLHLGVENWSPEQANALIEQLVKQIEPEKPAQKEEL